MRLRPYNKHRNIPTVVEGIRFASKKEAARYQELRLLEIAGEISNLKCHPRFPLWVNGELICTYIADFSYMEGKANPVYVTEDVKGYKKGPAYRLFQHNKNLLWAIHRIRVKEI